MFPPSASGQQRPVPRAFDEVKRQVWAAIFWQKGARRLLQRGAIERQHGELATRRRAA